MPPAWLLLALVCVNTISVTGYSSFFLRDGKFSASRQSQTLTCTRREFAAGDAGCSLTKRHSWQLNIIKRDRMEFIGCRSMYRLRQHAHPNDDTHRASSATHRLMCMLLPSERSSKTLPMTQTGWTSIFRSNHVIGTKSALRHMRHHNIFMAKKDGVQGLQMPVLAEEEKTGLGKKSAVDS
jgi:hypothetical protein